MRQAVEARAQLAGQRQRWPALVEALAAPPAFVQRLLGRAREAHLLREQRHDRLAHQAYLGGLVAGRLRDDRLARRVGDWLVQGPLGRRHGRHQREPVVGAREHLGDQVGGPQQRCRRRPGRARRRGVEQHRGADEQQQTGYGSGHRNPGVEAGGGSVAALPRRPVDDSCAARVRP